MKRRLFTQLLALGAGVLGALPAAADEQPGDERPRGDPKSPEAPRPGGQADAPHEPVNVEEFRRAAQAKLSKTVYEYITTGSADEITLRENLAAFQRLRLLPPLLAGVSKADLTTTVLGQRVSMPVLLAPVAVQRMFHP